MKNNQTKPSPEQLEWLKINQPKHVEQEQTIQEFCDHFNLFTFYDDRGLEVEEGIVPEWVKDLVYGE